MRPKTSHPSGGAAASLAANDASSGVLGFVADTKFSVDRGFYDTPFVLAITTATMESTTSTGQMAKARFNMGS